MAEAPEVAEEARLFERVRSIAGYSWDFGRAFHSSYDQWHIFGHKSAGTASSVSSPQSPTERSSSRRRDESATEAQAINVVARVSTHILREERSYTICRKVIASVDPEGLHVIKPLELLRLPPRNENEQTLVVAVVEHPGYNYLSRVMNFGPAWYFVKLHRVGDTFQTEPDTSFDAKTQVPLDKFLKFAVGAADCLEILHQGQRIVHGEIRGDAFHMNTETGHVKLTVASGSGLRTFEHGLTSTGWSLLSKELGAMTKLSYIAPEQTGRFNAQEDSRTDIYSLGIVLWTMLAQKSPFDGETPMDILMGILGRRVPLVSSIRIDVPGAIARVIQKMTAKAIGDRYQSVGGLRHDFLEIKRLLGAGDATGLHSFKIATQDVSSFFVLPNAMVGRTKDYEEIVRVIHKVARQHTYMQRQDIHSLSSDTSVSEGRQASIEQDVAGGLASSEDTSSIGGKTNQDGPEAPSGDLRAEKPKPNPLHTSTSEHKSFESYDISMGSSSMSIASSRPNHSLKRNSNALETRSLLSSFNSSGVANKLVSPGAGLVSNYHHSPNSRRKGRCEVLIIAGATGLGKTYLVQSAQAEARRHGYFASAKFESRRTPFAAVLYLLSALFKQVFSESNTDSAFHQALKQYIRPAWPLLHEVLGLPESLLGSSGSSVARQPSLVVTHPQTYHKGLLDVSRQQSPDPSSSIGSVRIHSLTRSAQSSQQCLRTGSSTKSLRLMPVYLDVIRMFTQHKFVCFCLDDIQLADEESLDLLTALVASQARMLLILTYRPDGILPDKIKEIVREGQILGSTSRISRISLNPLSEEDITYFVAQTLARPQHEVVPLAVVIHTKTGGNPFYMRQMLEKCHRTSCLYFDFKAKIWQYDLDRIFKTFESTGYHDTLNIDFIVERLDELPSSSRSILAWASFIGDSFSFDWVVRLMSGEFDYADESVLNSQAQRQPALSHSQIAAVDGIQAALHGHIIVATQDDDRFRFAHDRYVQAAKLMCEGHESRMHYIIARTLLKYYSTEDRSKAAAAPHICESVELIRKHVLHRQLFRTILVEYADSLAEKNARSSASRFYHVAISLLQDDPWDANIPDAYYEETLQLYNRAADCYMSHGLYENAAGLITEILSNASNTLDKAFAYVLRCRMMCREGRALDAIESLGTCLKGMSVSVTKRTTTEECDREFDRLLQIVRAMDKDELVNWQPTTDKSAADLDNIGAIVSEASRAAFWSDTLAFYQWTLIQVDTYLTYGGFPQSSVVFMNLAMVAITRFNKISIATELGKISLALMDKWKDPNTVHRDSTVYTLFVGHVHQPLRPQLSILERNLESCIQQGDRNAIIIVFGVVACVKFFASQNVAEIESFCHHGCEEVDNWAMDTRGATMVLSVRQLCRSLMGRTSKQPHTLMSDEHHDSLAYKRWLKHENTNGERALLFYESCELVAMFLYGYYEEAVMLGNSSMKRVQSAWSARHTRSLMFYYALSLAGALWNKLRDPLRQLDQLDDSRLNDATLRDELDGTINLIKYFKRKIEEWQVVCDINYLAWSRLLAAQIAELEGDHGKALTELEGALDHASAHDFILEEAVGNYLLASLFLRAGSKRPAKAALREAMTLYRQIGAIGVADHLEQEHHLLLREPTRNLRTADTGVQTDLIEHSVPYQAMQDDEKEHSHLRRVSVINNTSDRIGAWQGRTSRPEAGSNLPALDMIDLTAILESSQVISSMLQVDQLLKTMCEIILQNCGGLATLATIIIEEDGVYSIAASADPERGATAHIPGMPLTETALVAESVILYCTRFRDSVFLPELTQDERFSNVSKEWLALNPTGKSVIAIPIARGDHPLGVLYVEGLPHAFSDRNLTVLQLLVNQVGISLSNAMVMKQVEKISAFNNSMVEIQRSALTKALRAEEKANTAKAAAEEAVKAKSIFLANVSHELRTPLNGVIGNSELLKDSPLDARQAEWADSIRLSADLLLTVINDILDFSKMEADKMKLFIVAFNADEMIREVVRSVSYSNREKKSSKNVEILSDIDLPKFLIFGDPVRLHQVLGNLISNSLKFTENGSITVSATKDWESRDSVSLTFSVTDTGVGIAEAEQKKLFQPFNQADPKTNRKHGGSGLGLSICKILIEHLMGGKIGLESKAGYGTRVWFSIVLTKAPEAAAGDSQIELQHQAATPAKSKDNPVAGVVTKFSIPLAKIRVAIAEDNHINQQIAIQFMQKLGFQHIDAYDNGQRAVAGLQKMAAENNPYHIILMDVQMPVMDGYEATKLLRNDESPDVQGILVIAMTASAIQGDREKCLEAGMNDYLAKPVKVGVLRKKIEQYISTPLSASNLHADAKQITKDVLKQVNAPESTSDMPSRATKTSPTASKSLNRAVASRPAPPHRTSSHNTHP